MLTFAKFRATATPSADLSQDAPDHCWEDCTIKPEGNIYLGCLFIEKVLPHWPAPARAEGGWHLIIGRDEYITDDLLSLECKLYDFAISAGYGE